MRQEAAGLKSLSEHKMLASGEAQIGVGFHRCAVGAALAEEEHGQGLRLVVHTVAEVQG